jgi:mannose-6-phosphate isomerase class I
MNLMQYAEQFLGKYLSETYPRLFPLDVWLDDGYFPKPTPPERTSMPIHNHPGTDYVQRHFKEPLGRYETYYIAEAYEGASTWLGFKDDANVEEWERLCRESNNLKEIPNWKDFIQRWDSNVGDLYLIPAGTTHGSGGNQMVLEMDTCPSIAGTEYSFFMYDFARHTWDDKTKTMTGKPCRMHCDHGFNIDKTVRASWAKDHLRAKPKVIKWTKEYSFDRYSSDPRMPFEIERFHFTQRAENDTEGKFLQIVTLTVGNQVTIRSKSNPAYTNTIRKFQAALVPACFGEYEFVNDDGSACTVVQLRWKTG